MFGHSVISLSWVALPVSKVATFLTVAFTPYTVTSVLPWGFEIGEMVPVSRSTAATLSV